MKAYGLWTDTFEPSILLPSFRAAVALIEVEALLGLSLALGICPRGARIAALVFFTTAAFASFTLALRGESSCGCLGRIRLNPWFSFAVDVVAVGAISAIPRSRVQHQMTGGPGAIRKVVGGAGAMLILLCAGVMLLERNPWATLAWLQGESVAVEPPISDVGVGSVGEERTFSVNLVNRSEYPITCIGGTTTCGCVATSDLPVTLSPGESRPIRVQMIFKGGKGAFQHRFTIYTDNKSQGFAVARFTGRITSSSE
jgi:hypothetical protein